MGKQRDSSSSDTFAQEYRRRLGRQEFRGRSKKDALKVRDKAQARQTNQSYIKDVILSVSALALVLAVLYMIIFYSLQR
ncbi:triple QxxK/R motif-containing protein-like [Sycon ciliatum]|uniref:triple QxxK/R motif-containing protein-like n=1 Tax=Sycon ciliatum TaxID=27933 RepID=UPI0020AE5475